MKQSRIGETKMPYIDQTDRDQISSGRDIETAGELNFVISTIESKNELQ